MTQSVAKMTPQYILCGFAVLRSSFLTPDTYRRSRTWIDNWSSSRCGVGFAPRGSRFRIREFISTTTASGLMELRDLRLPAVGFVGSPISSPLHEKPTQARTRRFLETGSARFTTVHISWPWKCARLEGEVYFGYSSCTSTTM